MGRKKQELVKDPITTRGEFQQLVAIGHQSKDVRMTVADIMLMQRQAIDVAIVSVRRDLERIAKRQNMAQVCRSILSSAVPDDAMLSTAVNLGGTINGFNLGVGQLKELLRELLIHLD